MDYVYKPVDFARPIREEPINQVVLNSLLQVYFALFCIFSCAFIGGHLHTSYGCGGLNSAMRVCLAVSWLMVFDERWIWARVFFMTSGAISFGATICPLLSHFIEIDPEHIKDFFMVFMLIFLTHLLSIRMGRRDVIHDITIFTAPLLTTLWMAMSKYFPEFHMRVAYLLYVSILLCIYAVHSRQRGVPVLGISIRFHLEFISFVSFWFEHSVVELILLYPMILFILVHLRMHTIHSMAAAEIGGNDFVVTATLTFFTECVGRSVYLAIDLGGRLTGACVFSQQHFVFKAIACCFLN